MIEDVCKENDPHLACACLAFVIEIAITPDCRTVVVTRILKLVESDDPEADNSYEGEVGKENAMNEPGHEVCKPLEDAEVEDEDGEEAK